MSQALGILHPVWSGKMSGRIFVRSPWLGEGFEREGWKQKLELGFALLLVGPSLEGDQDLPCGWWDSTPPLTAIQQGNFDLPFSSFPRSVWGPAEGNSLV